MPALSRPSSLRRFALAALFPALAVGVAACGPRLLGPTATRVGCYESEVKITEEAGTWDKRTWVAN